MNGFSIEIEKFLRFCRQCVDTNRRAAIAEIDADNKMQDILHRIELGENYPEDYITMGIAQANIRKERRVAKDVVKITYPIVQWVNKNQKTINELEKLLGDVRKEEKGTVGRKYSNRTKILDGLFEEEGGD